MTLNYRLAIERLFEFGSISLTIILLPYFINSIPQQGLYIFRIFGLLLLIPTVTQVFVGLFKKEARYCPQCGTRI